MDEYFPEPERAIDGDFLMPIEDVFSISGRGTVVTGRIERGIVKVNDKVAIIGIKDTQESVCTGVEMFRKLLDQGQAGDNVGVLLRGTKREEVERGQVLAKPGSITPHTKFEADREKVKKIFDKVKQEGRTTLLEEEGLEILNTYGFPLPKNILAKTEDEAVEAANKIGYSVVMKIASPQIVHKSDAGGVKINLTNDEEVRSAFKEIVENAKKYDSNAEIKGVLIVEMVKGGKEMIIGSKLEPGFGPVLMLGMGGIYVEILKDVTFRLAPVTDQEANDMISSIKTKKLLEGVRGEKPSDVEKLSECIQRLSQLVTDFKEIKELDMNPVLVMEKGEGCKILDVRIGI